MQRNQKQNLILFLKGSLMGAADAVPGVSGGTIAFISGIYEELLASLSKLGPKAVSVLFKQGPVAFWSYINASFLSILVLGMLSSILLLSNIVLFLLGNYPEILWGFFFGLISASSVLLAKCVEKWNLTNTALFIGGTLASYFLTTLSSAPIEVNLATVFFAGMLAICAMILPGISGSFILLLLGLYSYILTAVKTFDFTILLVFAAGCFAGLLSFSRVLTWLFKHHKNLTLALLTGFLFGSLNKVWPWKETLTTRVNRSGETVADLQQNVLPWLYSDITSLDSHLVLVSIMFSIGIMLVFFLDKVKK